MVHRSRVLVGSLLAVLAFGAVTVGFYQTVVDLSKPFPAEAEMFLAASAEAPGDTVFVGVISRYPSSVIYSGYQPVLDYLTVATGRYFALRLGGSYEETVAQLVDGRVAAAFLGAYLYVKAHDEHGVVSIVQPVNEDGTPWFRSALIVNEDSDINGIADLAGRRLALPPELSFSANWLSAHAMPAAGLDFASVASVRHLPHHHSVVYEVLRGNADAGVVKDRIAQEFLGRGVRVVAVSDPIPGAPIVVPARHDPALVLAIRDALLSLDRNDPAFPSLTAGWDPEFANGFTLARDEDYDALRAMLAMPRR